MPWMTVPLATALIGAGTAGTEIGLQASGALTPSTSGQTAALEKSQQQQQQEALQQAFKHFAPNLQEQTSGYITDAASSQMLADVAGSPGDIGLAQQTVFGTTTPRGLTTG